MTLKSLIWHRFNVLFLLSHALGRGRKLIGDKDTIFISHQEIWPLTEAIKRQLNILNYIMRINHLTFLMRINLLLNNIYLIFYDSSLRNSKENEMFLSWSDGNRSFVLLRPNPIQLQIIDSTLDDERVTFLVVKKKKKELGIGWWWWWWRRWSERRGVRGRLWGRERSRSIFRGK